MLKFAILDSKRGLQHTHRKFQNIWKRIFAAETHIFLVGAQEKKIDTHVNLRHEFSERKALIWPDGDLNLSLINFILYYNSLSTFYKFSVIQMGELYIAETP